MGADSERIAQTFIDLADTLASDYDIADFLYSLVERCQEILNVDAGGVLLEAEDGQLRLVAATTDTMKAYEEAEIRDNEGPCMDAYRRVEQVFAVDLNDEHERWPTVAATALGLGLQAVYAFPIRLRKDCIGALNLYRGQPGVFPQADIRLAQAFADMAAIGILQQRHFRREERRATQLQEALNSRIVIEQAKGILAAQGGVSPEAAFDRMRREARSRRMRLQEVAAKVVARTSAGRD